ncbi:MAG: sigma-54-dependent Fis family transcriptional regulator [Proteobacteria bacterium]|nr:sigma-54-dependent Fis family transcriptional regulator [Pseudomonadota bacterium]
MQWNSETRYKILLTINNSAITKVTREDLFQALAAELRKYFAYDRLSINLYDDKFQTISYFASADGIHPKGISSNDLRPLEKGTIARMVIESGQPVVVGNLEDYSDYASVKSMLKSGLTATLAFPLTIHHRILGSIHFSFKKEPADFSELTTVLTEVSQQITLAVDNMLSYTTLVKENTNLVREKNFLLADSDSTGEPDHYFYASNAMAEVVNLVQQTADTDLSVLITGETGTGKDYLARHIHKLSSRRDRLFVKINCPALTPSLFESELFGHKKGAFTGADAQRIGRFEMADEGTIFLDEVGELPLALQAKLLHVLQDKRFERVGESVPIAVDFRTIAATNRDMEADIPNGQFRKDLYYRLNAVNIHVPPLRERPEDIPHLVENLTGLQAREMNRPAPTYSEKALKNLGRYHWPGNVRELKNIVHRLVILKPGERLTDSDVDKITNIAPQSETEAEITTLADAERRHIEQALIKCRGVVSGKKGAARLLGLPRSTFQYRLKKHGLEPNRYS